MTKQHPITPPPLLVQQCTNLPLSDEERLVVAAQWGADQELEACCEWAEGYAECGNQLHAARRSQIYLKHLALQALHRNWDPTKSEDYYIILCALQSITYEPPPLSNP
jgi:hypothetical protein